MLLLDLFLFKSKQEEVLFSNGVEDLDVGTIISADATAPLNTVVLKELRFILLSL